MKERLEKIAKVCHEANKALCETLGDNSQQPWEFTSEENKSNTINAVRLVLNNPDTTPETMHIEWMKSKLDAGWTYGGVKDSVKKTHPSLLPYDALELEEQLKDSLMINTINALSRLAV